MKVKCDKFNKPCDYLTEGKEYECFPCKTFNYMYVVIIIDDVGEAIHIWLKSKSAHTNSQWQIVEEK